MSTMLKYAAMSLLSKTLQTFLYKYLLDVDVEGVAMPSFMDADGHSGWGVRLCNVRLREGVELMTLPGKRKVKRPKPKETEHESKESTSEEEQTRETMMEGARAEAVSNATATEPVTQPLDEYNVATEQEHVERRSVPVSPDYYASDDGESDISGDEGPRSRTSSVAETRSWVCFSRGTAKPKDATPPVSFTPTTKSLKGAVEEDATQATQSSLSLAADGEASQADLSSQKETISPDAGREEDEEEEEYIEVENDMVLRLGNGGRIGVLDVRLVGKELHVSVEDAFLVVEACQRPEEPTDDTDAASMAGSEKEEGPKGKESAGDKKKPAASKKADMSEGERVLDKSAIARALSAIPHLFLRDCRVQLVVRDGDVGREAEADISVNDSVLDLGIELLSVTSGEDFLAHVRADEDATSSNAFDENAYKSQTSFASYDESSNNEFIVKRIRTGGGPEGGMWLKIFPPGKRNDATGRPKACDDKSDEAHQWARERWMRNTEFCFFRCSGLDVRSRIFVGKQEEAVDEFFFYDEFSVDSMLVGVDYVAPGPAPALPPLSQSADAAALEAMQAMGGANSYDTDSNGIQSVKVDSVFHKVARGLVPTACQGDHLPCETCTDCWTSGGKSVNTLDHHPLDDSTPLAGVVLNLSLNDPLEVNVDRASLEVIGQLVGLFMKKTTDTAFEISDQETEEDSDVGASTHGGRLCMPAPRRNTAKKTDITDSFPTYMQPENIEILGLHLATIVIRIHAMRSDGSYDGGLSFCYWETQTRCITMDMQTLSSEKNLQDIRIDVAEFSAIEYKGVKHSQLVALGLPRSEVPSSDSNSTASKRLDSSPKSPWPSTTYALLGIPAPLETIHYESRERHALQLRYIAVSRDTAEDQQSTVDLRIGVTLVDMPWTTKDDVYSVISESKKSVFGAPPVNSDQDNGAEPAAMKPASEKETASTKSSLMKCKIRFDGGRVNVRPVINICLPPSTFFAEKSSGYGLFIETMLQRLEFAYGERAVVTKARRTGLSLFAALPEGVRLRVLLFVQDLGPLETALGLKHEKNALLRYRSVNKGIVKVAKESKTAKRKKGKSRMSSNQREEVLAELLSMDDVALQELWALHRSNIRKPKGVARKASI